MKTTLKTLGIIAVVLTMAACDSPTKRLQQAQALYNKGAQLREQRRSEEAAEKFLQGLALIQRSNKTDETIQLEGQLCDNLGAMYLKHGLFDDAFKQHQQALNCFKQVADSSGMMNAYRNSGRAVRAQEQYTQAKQYYDSAFRVATFINDRAMLADLYLEMGRDYYMETGNFAKGIESVNQALEIGLGDNDTDIAHMTLGILYYYTRENEKAKSYLNQALRSERAGLKMSVYQTLYAIAYSEGDYQQAVKYHEQFAANMMQADTEHANENIQRIKSEYELKAQQSELESLHRTRDLESLHRTRDLKLYLIIALAVIALLVILLIVRKKISDHKLEMEHFGRQVERDQNRIHELVSDMENLGDGALRAAGGARPEPHPRVGERHGEPDPHQRRTAPQPAVASTEGFDVDPENLDAKQDYDHRAGSHGRSEQRLAQLRADRQRLERLHQPDGFGLRWLLAAAVATLPQTQQVGRAHLLPLQERLLQPSDFHPVGHSDRLLLQTQNPHKTDEDGPRG